MEQVGEDPSYRKVYVQRTEDAQADDSKSPDPEKQNATLPLRMHRGPGSMQERDPPASRGYEASSMICKRTLVDDVVCRDGLPDCRPAQPQTIC